MLYLMGAAASDPEDYQNADPVPSERAISWEYWEKANAFFCALANKESQLESINRALASLVQTYEQVGRAEKWALLINAWTAYATGRPVDEDALRLDYEVDSTTGVATLQSAPIIGGIDVGDPKNLRAANDPTPEEIAEGTHATVQDQAILVRGKQHTEDVWGVDDTAWVVDPHSTEPPYFSRLTCEPFAAEDGTSYVNVEASDGNFEVRVEHLRLTHPDVEEAG